MIEHGASDLEIASQHFGTWTRARGAVRDYRKLINTEKITVKHDITTFPESWQHLEDNFNTIILWGESGIGKTCLAKALLPEALMVSHTDDLLKYNPDEYDGIIFDDMDFKHFPRSAQIHLLDWDDNRSIHCRYVSAFIPANTRKIFTTNEPDGSVFDLTDAAIRRRVEVHHLLDFS